MTTKTWRIRLSPSAEADYFGILTYTAQTFGKSQADLFERHLLTALAKLEGGPDMPGSLARPEIGDGLRTLHIARRGISARHIICYRATAEDVIEIIRILHDAMDLPRHLSSEP